jgi:hypothetical protein
VVTPPLHPESGLLKATWYAPDFPGMEWRGSMIHAVHIGRYEDNRVQILEDGTVDTDYDDLDDTVPWYYLFLDLDYVVSRAGTGFWVAPATLAFTSADGVAATIGEGSLSPETLGLGTTTTSLVVEEVRRIDHGPKVDPFWHIVGEGFHIRLGDPGFTLHIRSAPRLVDRPFLDAAERGGVSVEPKSYA